MSWAALATANSVFPREGREDGAFVDCTSVGVSAGTGKGIGNCKSGKGERKDDSELHVAFFVVIIPNTKYWRLFV